MKHLLEIINTDGEPNPLGSQKPENMTKEELIALRQKMNLNQRELAELIGTGTDVVSRWESGKHKISPVYQRLLEGLKTAKEGTR